MNFFCVNITAPKMNLPQFIYAKKVCALVRQFGAVSIGRWNSYHGKPKRGAVIQAWAGCREVTR